MAKRLRMAGALNRTGRILYFYGLGIALAANNANHEEFKFEAVLLSQFQQARRPPPPSLALSPPAPPSRS